MRQVVMALALVLAGCATGYAPKGSGRTGYSELRLNQRDYEVRFDGNGWTSPTAARDGALRRAAELTLAHRGAAFVVLGDRSSVATHIVSFDDDPMVAQKPTANITIRILSAAEARALSDGGATVYDARLLLTGRAGETMTAQR